MSFDAEWAQHKAAALAGRPSPALRLNQVAPEAGGSPAGSLPAGAGSLNGNANLPADRLTEAQKREIAARCNGGPYGDLGKAQGYGDRFVDDLGGAKEAMR
ncbi:hypothetical protein AB0D66_18925 [Streptomyces sp. NPDC048270]|uniref:hypothetical protein n=1 Tax=Streptomyces sp. NPDC048270 TaxID=3154615 RepID=UPI0033D42411